MPATLERVRRRSVPARCTRSTRVGGFRSPPGARAEPRTLCQRTTHRTTHVTRITKLHRRREAANAPARSSRNVRPSPLPALLPAVGPGAGRTAGMGAGTHTRDALPVRTANITDLGVHSFTPVEHTVSRGLLPLPEDQREGSANLKQWQFVLGRDEGDLDLLMGLLSRSSGCEGAFGAPLALPRV